MRGTSKYALVLMAGLLLSVPLGVKADTYSENSSENLVIEGDDEITSGMYTGKITLDGGTISGGTFTGTVEVTSESKVKGGTFKGKVTIADAEVSGGTFNNNVSISGADCKVTKGTFNGNVTISDNSQITGGTFTGDVVISGGILSGGSYDCSSVKCEKGTISGGTYKNLTITGSSSETNVSGCTINGGYLDIPSKNNPTVKNITVKKSSRITLDGLKENQYSAVFSSTSGNDLPVTLTSDPVRTMALSKVRSNKFGKITVNFDSNDGSGNMEEIFAYVEGSLKLPKNSFTKSMAIFKGWNLDPEGTALYKDEAEIPLCSALGDAGSTATLYAIWGNGTADQSADKDLSPANAVTITTETGNYKKLTNTEVSFAGSNTNGAKKFEIPETITDSNSKKYKVTAIESSAFKDDKNLTKIEIGSNVKKVGKNAFSGCKKLNSITINANKFKSIGKNSFKGIKKNAKITIIAKKKSTAANLLEKINRTGGAKTAKLKYKRG